MRNPDLIDNIDTWGAPTYKCVEWQVSDLLNCQSLPCFGGVTQYQFLAMPPPLNPYDADARYANYQVPFDQIFQLEAPRPDDPQGPMRVPRGGA